MSDVENSRVINPPETEEPQDDVAQALSLIGQVVDEKVGSANQQILNHINQQTQLLQELQKRQQQEQQPAAAVETPTSADLRKGADGAMYLPLENLDKVTSEIARREIEKTTGELQKQLAPLNEMREQHVREKSKDSAKAWVAEKFPELSGADDVLSTIGFRANAMFMSPEIQHLPEQQREQFVLDQLKSFDVPSATKRLEDVQRQTRLGATQSGQAQMENEAQALIRRYGLKKGSTWEIVIPQAANDPRNFDAMMEEQRKVHYYQYLLEPHGINVRGVPTDEKL